jgi:hypothetical protein
MSLRLLFLICCCICVRAFAADKVEINTEPSWLYKVNADLNIKPPSKEITGGYYFPLLDRQVNLLTQTEYIHVIRKIDSEKGVQNASEVSVTFSPQYQQVVFHKVNLWRDGKLLSELKRSQIKVVQEETEASDFLYNGTKRAFVVLKNVKKGDEIEYAYSLIGFNPVFDNKYDDDIYFGYETPICNYFQTLIAPASTTFHLKTFNNAPEPVREVNGTVQVFRWHKPTLRQWPNETGTPSWFNSAPVVTITEYKSWLDVIHWGLKLFNNYQHELPSGLKRKITAWRQAANGDKDKFTTLALRFVQDEVRYLGLEIGVNTHKPHSPAEVYEQLFGDCKDKALLLASILRQENIPAYAALVHTDKRSKLVELAPSAVAFNHVIVAIERGSRYLYVDPTISSQKGALLNNFVPAYGYALVIADKETTLKPVSPGLVHKTSIREQLQVSYKDTSRLTVTTSYKGGSADDFRSNVANSGMNEMEETYVKFYDKIYEGIKMSESVSINEHDTRNEVEVKESYSIPQLYETGEDGKRRFDVFARLLYNQLPEPVTTLKDAPLALEFPLEIDYALELQMPDGMDLSLKPLHIKTDAFEFDFTPEAIGKIVTLRYSLQTFKDHIPAEAIRKYKSDYKKMVAVLDVEFTSPVEGADTAYSLSGVSETTINWRMIYLFVIITAALLYGLRRVNTYGYYPPYQPGSGWPVSGWLVVLGISLGINCLLRAVQLIRSDVFSRTAWDALRENGGAAAQGALFAGSVLSWIWLFAGVALLYWFLNRRDIFPRIFLWYVGSRVVGEILLLGLYYAAFPGTDLAANKIYDFTGTVIYSVVWGLYVLRSERVKNTFLEPLA